MVTDMCDFGRLHIREWEGQYYHNTTKIWLIGILSVTVEGVEFHVKTSSNTPVNLTLKYSDFAEVKKTTTGLIFGAVVIILKNGEKHWFSSLPNRDDVYNVIQYFYQSNVILVDNKVKCDTNVKEGKTEMGRKLLSVVHDSHITLGKAAENLSSQGGQIDSVLTSMTDIHNDLDIAENLSSGMEAWFGRWHIPDVYKKVDPVIVNERDIPEISEYEILYTKMEVNKMNTQKLGLLRISQGGLFILTEKQKLVHNFKWSEISRIRVISPCEVIVTRYLIGQPDLSFVVICTTLLGFLEFLEKKLRGKLEYMTSGFIKQEPVNQKVSPTFFRLEKNELVSRRSAPSSISKLHTSEGQSSAASGTSHGDQLQISQTVVSDEEVKELQNTLSDLRSLALAVQQETDVQNEKLDTLTTSVDKANIRIKEVDRRVKKLS